MQGAQLIDRAFAPIPRPLSRRGSQTPSFWRLEPPQLDSDGRVKVGGMWPSQRAWWELPNFIKLLVGGFGSGKTRSGCKRIISSALENAPAPVAMVSLTYPVARETTISTVEELLNGKKRLLGSAFRWKYNKTDHVYTIWYHGRRGRIILYTAEHPERLVGPNLAAAYLDEPFLMDEKVFRQMIARVRHPDAVRSEIFCTGTPESMNWGYDIAEGEDSERYDVGLVRMSSRENKVVPDWYVPNLESAFTGEAAKAYIEGYFVNLATGRVYYQFDPEVNVRDVDEIPYGAQLGIGMDFNVNPMAFVAFWHTSREMHVFQEWELPNSDTEYACQVIKERFPNRDITKGPVLTDVYPDASGSHRATAAPAGKSDFWYIREAGFTIRANAANPKRKDRYNAVNGAFKSADGKVKLTVHSRCRKLRKYLQIYKHEDINSKEQQARSHLLDAMSYPVHFLFPVTSDALRAHDLQGW